MNSYNEAYKLTLGKSRNESFIVTVKSKAFRYAQQINYLLFSIGLYIEWEITVNHDELLSGRTPNIISSVLNIVLTFILINAISLLFIYFACGEAVSKQASRSAQGEIIINDCGFSTKSSRMSSFVRWQYMLQIKETSKSFIIYMNSFDKFIIFTKALQSPDCNDFFHRIIQKYELSKKPWQRSSAEAGIPDSTNFDSSNGIEISLTHADRAKYRLYKASMFDQSSGIRRLLYAAVCISPFFVADSHPDCILYAVIASLLMLMSFLVPMLRDIAAIYLGNKHERDGIRAEKYCFSSNGLYWVNRYHENFVSWPAIYAMRSTKSLLMLFINKGNAILLPRRYLTPQLESLIFNACGNFKK